MLPSFCGRLAFIVVWQSFKATVPQGDERWIDFQTAAEIAPLGSSLGGPASG